MSASVYVCITLFCWSIIIINIWGHVNTHDNYSLRPVSNTAIPLSKRTNPDSETICCLCVVASVTVKPSDFTGMTLNIWGGNTLQWAWAEVCCARHLSLCCAVLTESRAKKAKNWEDADFYDSDEDTFLDRTGDIERKRQKRILRVKPSDHKTETYESLVSATKCCNCLTTV